MIAALFQAGEWFRGKYPQTTVFKRRVAQRKILCTTLRLTLRLTLCVTLRLTLRNSALNSLRLTPLIPAQKMPDPEESESGIKQPKIN